MALMFSSHFIFRHKWKTQTAPGFCGLLLRWSAVMQKQTVRTDNELVINTRTALTRLVWITAWLSCHHVATMKANSANKLSQMLFARYLWSLLFLYGALLYLTNWNNAPNKRKWRAEKGCSAKFGCNFESSLCYSTHLLDCRHLFSEGVYTDQSTICIGLLHATWILFPKQIWLLADVQAHDLDTRNNMDREKY